MAMAFNPNFNPAQLALGGGSGIQPAWGNNPPRRGPYLPTKPMPKPGGPPRGISDPRQTPPTNTVQPESVRATGTGPYDPAYRQDLATYAGGNLQKPGGNLSFNPTAMFGQAGGLGGNPTGGGNAPVQGLPTDLLSLALGGQGFSTPQPTQPTPVKPAQPQNWQDWIKSLNMGNMFGMRTQ